MSSRKVSHCAAKLRLLDDACLSRKVQEHLPTDVQEQAVTTYGTSNAGVCVKTARNRIPCHSYVRWRVPAAPIRKAQASILRAQSCKPPLLRPQFRSPTSCLFQGGLGNGIIGEASFRRAWASSSFSSGFTWVLCRIGLSLQVPSSPTCAFVRNRSTCASGGNAA